MTEGAALLDQRRQDHYTDQHWAELLHIIQETAKAHFGKQPPPKDPTKAAQVAERRSLLHRRAQLKQELQHKLKRGFQYRFKQDSNRSSSMISSRISFKHEFQ